MSTTFLSRGFIQSIIEGKKPSYPVLLVDNCSEVSTDIVSLRVSDGDQQCQATIPNIFVQSGCISDGQKIIINRYKIEESTKTLLIMDVSPVISHEDLMDIDTQTTEIDDNTNIVHSGPEQRSFPCFELIPISQLFKIEDSNRNHRISWKIKVRIYYICPKIVDAKRHYYVKATDGESDCTIYVYEKMFEKFRDSWRLHEVVFVSQALVVYRGGRLYLHKGSMVQRASDQTDPVLIKSSDVCRIDALRLRRSATVLGIVIHVSDKKLWEFEPTKIITIVDVSGCSISVFMQNAVSEWEIPLNSTVLFRKVNVSRSTPLTSCGIQLSPDQSDYWEINPQIIESQQLLQWYHSLSIKEFYNRSLPHALPMLAQIESVPFPTPVIATITYITPSELCSSTPATYLACSICSKKVGANSVCPKGCNGGQEPRCLFRYQVKDYSGSRWFVSFNTSWWGTNFGPHELASPSSSDVRLFAIVARDLLFLQLEFNVHKNVIQDVQMVNYQRRCEYLIQRIREYVQ